jgi:hypothetical protein
VSYATDSRVDAYIECPAGLAAGAGHDNKTARTAGIRQAKAIRFS